MVTGFRFGDWEIGAGRCFVIAEAGVNHNGDVELAHRLIDAAGDAEADAVKFQTFDPERLVSPSASKAEYQIANTGTAGTQLEMLRSLVLPREAHAELQSHAEERSVCFLSTPFDEGSADFLHELGVPLFKVGSGDLTNHSLLAHLARKGLPLIISTGMASLGEVEEAVAVVEGAGDPPIALLHCVSNYPASPENSNLRAVDTLRETFSVPVGWSDHTEGIWVSLAAAARGADVVEKHFTLERTLPGPDHVASLEPDELRDLVHSIRRIETTLGDGLKAPIESEMAVAAVARRSLHARVDLSVGHRIGRSDLIALRPGTGIEPARLDEVCGRVLRAELSAGEMITSEHLGE